jgi:predicted CXXCH cytochrome family protein
MACHTPHGSPFFGGGLIVADSYANLCLSCHTPEGDAAGRAFAEADQALPGISGDSHRWDSGPSGHVVRDAGNVSSGGVQSEGVFTGRVERSVSITISTSGDVGVATFAWNDSAGNAGSATTAASVPLVNGLGLIFADGAGSPSFVTGDLWTLFVRTDLRLPNAADPNEVEMANRVLGGKVSCPVCHDPHSQELIPFDPAAPAYGGAGTGAGRHFQRADNDQGQVCLTCHSPRDVQSSTGGSHPVRVTVPGGGGFKAPDPAVLPLNPASEVVCMTCHATHAYNGVVTDDGYLLRDPMQNYLTGSTPALGNLCTNCHTLADMDGGAHFDAATGALWPGGQYGSSFPEHTDATTRGACVNCHWPHGWPDDAAPAGDYPKLWVERYDTDPTGRSDPDDAEDLCLTCHDPDGPATSDIKTDIEKGGNGTDIFHHPVRDSEQATGRTVECVDCHNPHEATSADRHAGVSGVDISGAVIPAGSRAIEQYELCFKCHGDSYNSGRANTSNKRSDFAPDNSAFHPVYQQGRNQSPALNQQLSDAGLSTTSQIRCTDCHNSDAFDSTSGIVTDSPVDTVGPHGSSNAPILRANFNRNYTSTGWSNNNAALCFRCHDQNRLLAAERRDGARTNFYDTLNGKDNLHWVHLVDRNTTASCMSCHYDIHSNISADNTQYRINGVLYVDNNAVSVARIKTHMVNFAPDITAIDGLAKPEWQLDTSSRVRGCALRCHGETMRPGGGSSSKDAEYRPNSNDDETTWIY